MKRNFGFDPYEGSGKYGFVSYKSDEYLIVGKYAKALSEKGVSLWYDYGIPEGKWEDTISEKIVGASFIVLFVSAKIFESDFIKTEIETARKWKIPIIPVFMEDLGISQIAPRDATFFTKLYALQGVSGAQKMSVEAVADELERLVRPKMTDDGEYAITFRKKNFEKERQAERLKPVQPQQPQYIPQPTPDPTQTYQKAESTTSVFREPEKQNPPKSTAQVFHDTEKQEPVSPAVINDTSDFLQKYKPAIAAVAIVLVVAIVIAFVVNIILNRTNDNLPDIKSVNDITSIDEISVGDHLTFGTYEQDNDVSNGKEDIEWRVLAVEDGKALLITEKLLDYVQYNEERVNVTWETCTLRKWMNGDFLNEAFTSSEQNKIATTTLSNPDNPDYGTEGGNDTQDKIFALSIDEAEKYFSSGDDRIAYVTEYAKSKGYASNDGSGWWWLRSPGSLSIYAAYVHLSGGVGTDGSSVFISNVAVRLAFWLNLSEDDAQSINDNLTELKSVNDITSIDEIAVGDHLTFGTYEQDNDTSNGKEDIEWRVLAVEDGKALLITEKLLDYVQYNEAWANVTWETCTLRKWMNGDFLNEAFTSSEQNKIATTTLSNPDNSSHNTEGGNDTRDKIFALSIDEAEKYFSSDDDRRAYVTEYAKSKGYDYIDGSGWWWLRSPGDLSYGAAFVLNHGGVDPLGNGVINNNVAVRLAFWLNL